MLDRGAGVETLRGDGSVYYGRWIVLHMYWTFLEEYGWWVMDREWLVVGRNHEGEHPTLYDEMRF